MPDPHLPGVVPTTTPPLRALAESRPGLAIVWVGGELDAFSCPRLERLLTSVAADRHTDLVLDLKKLSFVDTAGVELLTGWSRRLRARGDRLSLVRPPVTLALIAAITGEWADLVLEPGRPEPAPAGDVIDIRLRLAPEV